MKEIGCYETNCIKLLWTASVKIELNCNYFIMLYVMSYIHIIQCIVLICESLFKSRWGEHFRIVFVYVCVLNCVLSAREKVNESCDTHRYVPLKQSLRLILSNARYGPRGREFRGILLWLIWAPGLLMLLDGRWTADGGWTSMVKLKGWYKRPRKTWETRKVIYWEVAILKDN